MPKFITNIWQWNNAFSMASMGMDKKEAAPPANGNPFAGNIKIQGKLYHQVGNVAAPNGLAPSFLQLYFIDSKEAATCRCRLVGVANLDEEVLATLTRVIDSVSPYIKDIKTALEVVQEQVALQGPNAVPVGHIIISSDWRLLSPDAHVRTCNVPETTEVAGIILGDQHVPRSREGAV
eukprot:TCALIF_14171-PA protein Name:"Protein of unknown function" AED:0.23 eAED:0.23 QI:0/-1/0/1/-1/1/1/0/177